MIVFIVCYYPGFLKLIELHLKHGRPHLTAQSITRAALAALQLFVMFLFVSCDERNEADIPPRAYTFRSKIVTTGVAQNVDCKQNMLAIGASSSGTFVYDISNAGSPSQVFHYPQSDPFYTTYVGIDPVNNLVLTVSEPDGEPGDKYPIHNYTNGTIIGYANFSGGIVETEIVSRENELYAWRSDISGGDGLLYSPFCYLPDSGRWRPNYCTNFYFPYIPINVRIRGFGVNGDLFAVAQSNYQFRIFDVLNNTTVALVPTPGDPQDCAWYGNYILVADNLFLTVVDVSTVSAPEVATWLIIPGADRLIRIVVDGTYACILDDADGVYIVDVSDPVNPKYVQKLDFPEPNSISASNGKLVVADEQLGVMIYSR